MVVLKTFQSATKKPFVAPIQDGATGLTGHIFDARLANIGLWQDASLELALSVQLRNWFR